MSERENFIRAICAAPADDVPRLVFADWLEEHGDEARAESIRVQCKIARTEHYPGERFCADANGLLDIRAKDCWRCEPCRLRRREDELLKAHWRSWIDDVLLGIWNNHIADRTLYRRRDIPEQAFHFARGFISDLAVSWADCRAHLDAIREQTPLELVRLTTWPVVDQRGVTDYLDAGSQREPYRLNGRQRWHDWESLGTPEPNQDMLLIPLLAAEWPGIRFELPAAAQLIRSTLRARGFTDEQISSWDQFREFSEALQTP